MRLLIGVLGSLCLLLGWSSCGSELPNYDLDELQGTFRRTTSTNVDADSMLLKIEGSSGVVLYAPANSSFTASELKWTSIKPVVSPRDFTLSDKSADGSLWEAALYVVEYDGDSILQFRLESTEFGSAPGGIQTWVRE